MDFFGIGQAIKGCVNTYFQCSRSTGRTNSMVESLKNGDRVIFSNRKEAERVKRLARELGVTIETVVSDPRHFNVHSLGTSQGKTIFDHSFVQQYHENSIERVVKDLTYWEEYLSGFGVKHVKTKLKAREIAKWRC